MGPYREPGEDLERAHDAREVAAFREVLRRGTRRVRIGVGLAGLAALLAIPALFFLGSLFIEPMTGRRGGKPEGARTGEGASRCETRLITPVHGGGEPIPMTICR